MTIIIFLPYVKLYLKTSRQERIVFSSKHTWIIFSTQLVTMFNGFACTILNTCTWLIYVYPRIALVLPWFFIDVWLSRAVNDNHSQIWILPSTLSRSICSYRMFLIVDSGKYIYVEKKSVHQWNHSKFIFLYMVH